MDQERIDGMTEVLQPGCLTGTIAAIPSKSQAHRLLICAALSDKASQLRCPQLSRDIQATIDCLNALGAEITHTEGILRIQPIKTTPTERALLPCGESGSTLRFLLPVVGALGLSAYFRMEGRLSQRPMQPLTDLLQQRGMTIRQEGPLLFCDGTLQPGVYAIPGNISSQYISGLLFALPLLQEESHLEITTETESGSYIAMTLDALSLCGILAEETERGWQIPGGQQYRISDNLTVEGDWSNAAFFLCAGAISAPVTVTGLRLDSTQGDRAILDLLRQFGAAVAGNEDGITVSPAPLHGIEIDAAEIPDLIPVLCAVACSARGTTVIRNAARLRLKESDRLTATANLLNALGGKITELPDGLIIEGCGPLTGGAIDPVGDHRMAMTAAVCSLLCREDVIIPGAQCTEKSYPAFWQDFSALRKEPIL